MVKLLFVSLLIGFSFAQAGEVSGALDGKRLIETEPGKSVWMNDEQIANLSARGHESGKCPGFVDITDHQQSIEAQFTPSIDWTKRSLSHGVEVAGMISKVSSTRMFDRVTKLESYQNRYYMGKTGVESTQWLKTVFAELSAGRSDVSIREVKHKFDQPSLVVTLQGKGPHKDEILVVGGHLDSISGWWGGASARAPGADDNASGVVTVLEVFNVLMENAFQSDRTIEFMLYAGEEKGLLGSQDIAQEYAKGGKKVEGVMQFDMTMDGGEENAITFMTDFTNAGLNTFLEKLTEEYLHVKWGTSQCGYGCSDHASWFKAGYASSIPFESQFETMHHRLHTEDDQSKYLNQEFGSEFAKLGLAFVLETHQDQSF